MPDEESVGVQDEEQEAQEARHVRELGEQLAGFRHRVRLADDGDPEAGKALMRLVSLSAVYASARTS